jgi:DNA phosphorothioation-dependent restriction protein DptH
VPLDAHLELYKALRQNAQEMGDEVSFRRTDLALFDLDPVRRVVTCRLVEVKCYTQVGDVAAYGQLKASIAEQIEQTEHVIAHHFDPNLAEVDRPDRPIKNRDLATLLCFYLDRSKRYGVVLPEAAEEAHYFLRRLDERPYTLQFTRSAVVFDFSKPGTERAEHENGIEFYRIGSDLIRQLVESAVMDSESVASLRSEQPADVAREVTQELLHRRALAPAVPTFDTAAFLSPPRDRTLAWDDGPRTLYKPSSPVPADGVREPERVAVLIPDMVDQPDLPTTKAEIELPTMTEQLSAIAPADVRTEKLAAAAISRVDGVDPSTERVAYDIMLGATGSTPQYGLLGEVSGRKVALDRKRSANPYLAL